MIFWIIPKKESMSKRETDPIQAEIEAHREDIIRTVLLQKGFWEHHQDENDYEYLLGQVVRKVKECAADDAAYADVYADYLKKHGLYNLEAARSVMQVAKEKVIAAAVKSTYISHEISAAQADRLFNIGRTLDLVVKMLEYAYDEHFDLKDLFEASGFLDILLGLLEGMIQDVETRLREADLSWILNEAKRPGGDYEALYLISKLHKKESDEFGHLQALIKRINESDTEESADFYLTWMKNIANANL